MLKGLNGFQGGAMKPLIGLLAVLVAGVPTQGQVMRPLFTFPAEKTTSVTIDRAGTVVYAVSSTNQFGTNPDYRYQIVRWDPVTGAGTPITDFEEGVVSVSVSDDGSWLAFVSAADLLGTNHDESPELYVMHPDGTGLVQLTSESFSPNKGRGVRSAVISGSANRIAFVGRINPLGANPTYTEALFVVDRDGSNLRQLKTDVRIARDFNDFAYQVGLDISDDGTEIAYMSSSQMIFGINTDGTADHGFGSSALGPGFALSGNGDTLVYSATGGNLIAQDFDGNTPPTTIVLAANTERPWITDDATLVYYYRNAAGFQGIWKIASTGGTPALVAPNLRTARLSGGGGRILAFDAELRAIDGNGGNITQLTTTTAFGGGLSTPTFSPDASTLYFLTSSSPGTWEEFALSLGTEQLTQLHDGFSAAWPPSLSDTGTVVFSSSLDPTGQNSCHAVQIFRQAPGGPLAQLTACGGPEVHPRYYGVSGDAEVTTFLSLSGSPLRAYSVNGDGTGLAPFLNFSSGTVNPPEFFGLGSDGAPTWVTFCGRLASEGEHLIRLRSDGTGLQHITPPAGTANCVAPTISANGERLAWQDRGDHTGQNPDFSREAFAFDVPTGTFRQLTNNDSPIDSWRPRVTREGNYVFLTEARYAMSTSMLEPTVGSVHESEASSSNLYDSWPDATGNRWLVEVDRTLDRSSPRSMAYYLADMTALPEFTVGKGSPTELSWDHSPTSLRYDAIRGSIANLSIAGATVDLGPVTCLEDDSPDSHTHGHGDAADPAPGEAFFFLYRGSVGFDATAGSYGQGTGGKERVAGAGGCNP
jgi:Tol biopolymer transport system component